MQEISSLMLTARLPMSLSSIQLHYNILGDVMRNTVLNLGSCGLVLVMGMLGCKKALVKPTETRTPIITSDVKKSSFTNIVPEDLVGFPTRFHFDFDSSKIADSYNKVTEEAVQRLLAWGNSYALTITGNCDERGSDDYNDKLGLRRAEAVKELLVRFGMKAENITVETNGKRKPIATGHDEASWAKNRRSDIEYVIFLDR